MRQIKKFTPILSLLWVLFLCSNYAIAGAKTIAKPISKTASKITTKIGSQKTTRFESQVLRFIVASDSRSPKSAAGEKFPYNLYNKAVLTAFTTQVATLDPVPDFVMFLGDLVNFATPNVGDNPNAINNLSYWKSFMTSGLNGIPLYVCVGNSDLYGPTWWTEEARQTEFAEVFNNMPDNGPTTPVDFRHLVYSFELGSGEERSFFCVLDSFGIDGSKHCDNDFTAEQIDWFTEQANETSAPNKFVFSHGPAFSVEGFPVNYNVKKVWDIAMKNNFDAFFCAHEHLYYSWLINESVYPTAAGDLLQILTGTTGAVPDSPANILANLNQIYFGYTFVVVDVASTNITMQTYAIVQSGSTYTTQLIDKYVIIKPRTISLI